MVSDLPKLRNEDTLRLCCVFRAFMPNHFHLLLAVGAVPAGRLMQALLTSYARRSNRVHQRRGHLFQGRYKAIGAMVSDLPKLA